MTPQPYDRATAQPGDVLTLAEPPGHVGAGCHVWVYCPDRPGDPTPWSHVPPHGYSSWDADHDIPPEAVHVARGGQPAPARDHALDVATRALDAILAGEPATDGDYRAAADYPPLPPGQLDDGQIAAAAALERMRRIGAQPPTSPQDTDRTTGEQA